jgi:hypothetical protein
MALEDLFKEQAAIYTNQIPSSVPVDQIAEIDKPEEFQEDGIREDNNVHVNKKTPLQPYIDNDSVLDHKIFFLEVIQTFKKKTYASDSQKSFFPLLKPFFNDNLINLLVSESYDEFKQGINLVRYLIGRSKFFLAVFLYSIYDNWKYYKKKYGVKSWMDLINSFPDKYRMSRQSVYNSIMVGKLIVYISICIPSKYNAHPSHKLKSHFEKDYGKEYFCNLELNSDFEFTTIYPEKKYDLYIDNFFFFSYIKLIFATKLLKNGNNAFPSSLTLSDFLLHLKHDSSAEFKLFINSHLPKKKPEPFLDPCDFPFSPYSKKDPDPKCPYDFDDMNDFNFSFTPYPEQFNEK